MVAWVWIVSKTEEFIASLHVIAAGDDPVDRQKDAVREVFARCLREANEAFGGNKELVRGWVESRLKLELMKEALPPRTDRFADLRDQARALVTDWLRENPLT
jgi:hypothetical protein